MGFSNVLVAAGFATELTVDVQGDPMGLFQVTLTAPAGNYLLIAWISNVPVALYKVETTVDNQTIQFIADSIAQADPPVTMTVRLFAEDATKAFAMDQSVTLEQSEINDTLTDIATKLADPLLLNRRRRKKNHIDIIRGDAYDGIIEAKFPFDFGVDITGKAFKFTLRRKGDTKADDPLMEVEGVAAGTLCEPTITSDLTENLPVSIQPRDMKFDVEVTNSATSKNTIYGTATVFEDVT